MDNFASLQATMWRVFELDKKTCNTLRQQKVALEIVRKLSIKQYVLCNFFFNCSIPNKYYQAPQLWQPVPYSVTNLTRKGAARALLATNKHPCLLPQPHP